MIFKALAFKRWEPYKKKKEENTHVFLLLILEEIIMNIITYGYDDEESHKIEVQIEVEQEEVALTVTDDGKEFNPLTIPKPDRSKSAMDRLEEGLGLQFVRHMRNAMEYRREEDKNILKIWIFL